MKNMTPNFHDFSEAIKKNILLNDFTPCYSHEQEGYHTMTPYLLMAKKTQHATSVEVEELQKEFSRLRLGIAFTVRDGKLIVLPIKKNY